MVPLWSAAVVVIGLLSAKAAHLPTEVRASFQLPVPSAQQRLQGPASTYANLSPAECRKRLRESPWAASFRVVGPHNGVASPLRIIAPLHGVTFQVPPDTVSYGVLDCRQALLWIELAPVMARHGVEGIRIDNFYRNRARVQRGRKSQHAYALAADVVSVTFSPRQGEKAALAREEPLADPEGQAQAQEQMGGAEGEPSELHGWARRLPGSDSSELRDEATRSQKDAAEGLRIGYGEADVEDDFLGELGKPVCGPEARIVPRPDSDWEQIARALRLRDLVCEWGRMGAFHHILTPNYDRAHRNHLHLDLQRDGRWFSLR